MVLEPPIRDGTRLSDSGARPDGGARLGDSCAGPASEARDSAVDGGSCKTAKAAAMVPVHAVTTANQQPYDTMLFHRYL